MNRITDISGDRAARYVRYQVPSGAPANVYNKDNVYCCNIAEIEIYGNESAAPQLVPGDLNLDGQLKASAAGLLSVGRSTGDVTLRRCDAGELKITTSTGDVSGSLRTEKVFLTKTGTGRVEVPASTSGGTCEITTKTGDIKLSVG